MKYLIFIALITTSFFSVSSINASSKNISILPIPNSLSYQCSMLDTYKAKSNKIIPCLNELTQNSIQLYRLIPYCKNKDEYIDKSTCNKIIKDKNQVTQLLNDIMKLHGYPENILNN